MRKKTVKMDGVVVVVATQINADLASSTAGCPAVTHFSTQS
jgi:hypothetical protein